ncbi:MAG: cupin domain-containing protein [Deltaproteobacteria bacterium]|nr:cupin domain-containing protein [Deltaproteobacteria bacterium]
MNNIYATKVPAKGETFNDLLSHKHVKIERIVSSDEIPDIEYIQEHDEWVLLLKGRTTLEVQGDLHELKEGDYFFIPAKQPHKVLKAESGTIWLAVHILRRE